MTSESGSAKVDFHSIHLFQERTHKADTEKRCCQKKERKKENSTQLGLQHSTMRHTDKKNTECVWRRTITVNVQYAKHGYEVIVAGITVTKKWCEIVLIPCKQQWTSFLCCPQFDTCMRPQNLAILPRLKFDRRTVLSASGVAAAAARRLQGLIDKDSTRRRPVYTGRWAANRTSRLTHIATTATSVNWPASRRIGTPSWSLNIAHYTSPASRPPAVCHYGHWH